jgi:hypothetical protein
MARHARDAEAAVTVTVMVAVAVPLWGGGDDRSLVYLGCVVLVVLG